MKCDQEYLKEFRDQLLPDVIFSLGMITKCTGLNTENWLGKTCIVIVTETDIFLQVFLFVFNFGIA